MKARIFLIFSFLIVFGCKNDSNKINNSNSNSNNLNNTDCQTPGGNEPVFDVPLGHFFLDVGDSFQMLQGRVWHSEPPDPFTETARHGFCRLLESEPSFCDPACEWGTQVCISGACQDYPARRDAGALTVSGALASPVTVRPDAVGEYAWARDAAPVNSRIRLAAAGGDVGAFELETCVPAPIAVSGDWSQFLQQRLPGQDVELAWSNPQAGARVYLRMTTGVATHGGVAHAEIECEGPDTGRLVLPGAFLDRLYETGWACGECGGNTLYRYFSAQTERGGTVLQWRIATMAYFYHIPR